MKKKINYILSFFAIIFIIFGAGIKLTPTTETFIFVEEMSGDTISIVAGNVYEAQHLLYLDLPSSSFIKYIK